MKRILLTQGKHTIVDDEDYERLMQWKWYAHKEREKFYAIKSSGENINLYRMHRLILNAPENTMIDHRNGNGLDNRKQNLRFCTNSQNLQNARKRRNCSSKYKGVCWAKSKNKWQTNIAINQKMSHLGRYDTEIEAAKAYDRKAIELFGEFARLNFMTGEE